MQCAKMLSFFYPLLFSTFTDDVKTSIKPYSVKDNLHAEDTRLLTHMRLNAGESSYSFLLSFYQDLQLQCMFHGARFLSPGSLLVLPH